MSKSIFSNKFQLIWVLNLTSCHTYHILSTFYFLGISDFPQNGWLTLQLYAEFIVILDLIMRFYIMYFWSEAWDSLWLLREETNGPEEVVKVKTKWLKCGSSEDYEDINSFMSKSIFSNKFHFTSAPLFRIIIGSEMIILCLWIFWHHFLSLCFEFPNCLDLEKSGRCRKPSKWMAHTPIICRVHCDIRLNNEILYNVLLIWSMGLALAVARFFWS